MAAHNHHATPPRGTPAVPQRPKTCTAHALTPAQAEASALCARTIDNGARTAERLGISASKVSRWRSPDSEETPSLARLLECADGADVALAEAAAHALLARIEQRRRPSLPPALHALNATAAVGAIADVTREVLADGVVTKDERRKLRGAYRKAQATAGDAMFDLETSDE